MNNKYNSQDSGREATIFTRYKQMLYGSLIAACLGLINFLVLSTGYSGGFDTVRFSFYGGLVWVCGFAIYYAERKIQFSMASFVWGLTVLTTYLLWANGGLRGSANVMYPAVIIVAALLLPLLQAIALGVFILVMILILGLSEIYLINPYPMKPYTYEDVANIILLITASGLVAWLIGGDYRHMLIKLDKENRKNKYAQEKIKYLAHHDSLTGLHSIWECKNRYNKLQISGEAKVYFYFIDLDNFKIVNDNYGHPAGDSLLVEISKRLTAELEEHDIACRLGGDEFLLALHRDDSFSAEKFALNLMTSVTRPVTLEGATIDVTASLGIAVSPSDGIDFDDIRKKSDSAMYKAKQQGKNRYYFYNAHLHQEISRKNHIINAFKRALKDDSLRLNYQGIHDLSTNRIIGAEVLLRWVKNNPYNISPGEFIPVIESTDLIIDVGEWVIKQACKTCRQWREQGLTDVHIAVNISPMQLSKSNLVEVIREALIENQLPPHCLELEITEYLLISQTEQVLKQLAALSNLGVSLAIDDFGTGYSNLGYLTRFKVNTLKLDRSFINKLNASSKDKAMVYAIVNMGKILGLKITAEGVEHHEELKTLLTLGCDFGQGYFWERPCSENVFTRKILDRGIVSDEDLLLRA